MSIYEILVPTVSNDGKPFRTRFHRVWDGAVREIVGGGMTICSPTIKGEWIAPCGTVFVDRTIPVRVIATREQMEKIADLTAKHYCQKAIMFYKISDEVVIKHYG